MSATVTRPAFHEVRPDHIPVEACISRDWLELEREKLRPKVCRWVCREEEIPNFGDLRKRTISNFHETLHHYINEKN